MQCGRSCVHMVCILVQQSAKFLSFIYCRGFICYVLNPRGGVLLEKMGLWGCATLFPISLPGLTENSLDQYPISDLCYKGVVQGII